MGLLLAIVIFLLLFGGFSTGPWWPYSTGWGYYPSGGFGLLLIIVLVVWLLSR